MLSRPYMNIARLIAYCRDNGVEFYLSDDTVKVRGAAGIVEEILPVLRAHKTEIIEYLAIEKINICPTQGLPHESEPVFSETDAENAMIQTQNLLNRIMSRHA